MRTASPKNLAAKRLSRSIRSALFLAPPVAFSLSFCILIPGTSRRGEPVNFATSSDLVHTTVVSIRPVSERLELPSADPLVDCFRTTNSCLNS